MNNDTDTPRPTTWVEKIVALTLYACLTVMVIQLVARPTLTWMF